MDDDALFASLRDKLFTAVVGDVLDKMGCRRQFLPQAIGPLRPDMKLVGRAMPVLEADVFDEGRADSHNPLGGKPFGLMLEALDDLRPNEVYVATGGSFRYALWGELMSTRASTCAPQELCSMASSGMRRGSRRSAFPLSRADCTRRTRPHEAK